MGTKRDYYEILGIDQSADSDTIKKAYRKLVKKYHPDSNAGDAKAEERFKEVTEAYNILSDPEKRKLYDRFGHAAFQDTQAGYRENAGSWNNSDSGGGYREYHFEGDDMDDILKNIFGFQGSHFGEDRFYSDGFGGSGFGRRGFRQDGADLQADIDVSFDEAAFGCEKVIRLNHGDEAGGAVSSLKVKIPAGIDSGQSIRLRGKGMPGSGGGNPQEISEPAHRSGGFPVQLFRLRSAGGLCRRFAGRGQEPGGNPGLAPGKLPQRAPSVLFHGSEVLPAQRADVRRGGDRGRHSQYLPHYAPEPGWQDHCL